MVEQLQAQTAILVQATQREALEVREGGARARASRSSLEALVRQVEDASNRIGQIEAVAGSQQENLATIGRHVGGFGDMVDQAAGDCGQVADGTERLLQEAQELKGKLDRFKVA